MLLFFKIILIYINFLYKNLIIIILWKINNLFYKYLLFKISYFYLFYYFFNNIPFFYWRIIFFDFIFVCIILKSRLFKSNKLKIEKVEKKFGLIINRYINYIKISNCRDIYYFILCLLIYLNLSSLLFYQFKSWNHRDSYG